MLQKKVKGPAWDPWKVVRTLETSQTRVQRILVIFVSFQPLTVLSVLQQYAHHNKCSSSCPPKYKHYFKTYNENWPTNNSNFSLDYCIHCRIFLDPSKVPLLVSWHLSCASRVNFTTTSNSNVCSRLQETLHPIHNVVLCDANYPANDRFVLVNLGQTSWNDGIMGTKCPIALVIIWYTWQHTCNSYNNEEAACSGVSWPISRCYCDLCSSSRKLWSWYVTVRISWCCSTVISSYRCICNSRRGTCSLNL